MIKHKSWDINEHITDRFKGGKPIVGVAFQNGLNDIEPDGSFVPCDIGVSEVTQGVTHLKMNRGRMGELRFGDSSHPNSFLVKIKNKGLKGVSFKYTGATGNSMTANNGKPLCNFDNGISIESTPYYKGVKMDIIVNDPLAAPLEYPFSVKTYGQNYTFIEENGGATLKGEDQDPITIKPPYAVDANGDIGPVTIHSTGIVSNLITFKKVVDETWLRNAAAPVRIDPSITIEDGVDGGVLEINYIRGDSATLNYGGSSIFAFGFYLADYNALLGVDLSAYTGASVISAKFSAYSYGGTATSNINWYRVLREWGEGIHNAQAATTGESSYNAYSYPDNWTTAGCNGVGTDREGTPQNVSPISISTGGRKDFDCLPASVEADIGGKFSILIKGESGNRNCLSVLAAPPNEPYFYMEYTEGGGFQAAWARNSNQIIGAAQ